MSFFSKKKSATNTSPKQKAVLAATAGNLQALEPRIMFDAAGMVDFHDTVNELADSPEAPDSHTCAPHDIADLFHDFTPPAPNTTVKEIIFIDSGVENAQELLGNTPSASQIFTLDKEVDAVKQMTSILGSYNQLDAVHIVSHGHAGQLDFSCGSLNTSTLDSHSADLAAWSKSLSEKADIMIYGCDVASGTEGNDFISQISQLTNADVAASTDTTGNADQGADWDLETATGHIETEIAFSKSAQASWQGTLDTATLISVDSVGSIANGASSAKPDATPDGRYIAFTSDATNLVAGDSNSQTDVFVHDSQTGDTVRVSVDSTGAQANNASYNAQISFDGRFVTYSSDATNLVAGDSNSARDIFVHDRDADNDGIFDEAGAISTSRVSVDSLGVEADGNSYTPVISADGRYIAFYSDATNLVTGDSNALSDIFVHDRDADNDGIFDEAGAGAVTTTRISVDSSGVESDGTSSGPQMSADGRFITFNSSATNLVASDTNAQSDVFVHDRDADNDGIFDEGGAITTFRVSVDSSGAQATGGSSTNPVISVDGRFIAFESTATNLVAGDSNAQSDVFVYDRDADEDGIFDEAAAVSTTRVSVASDGTEGNSWSNSASISDGGHLITFTSNATNLVAGDVNASQDVFIHETFAGETTLASDLLNAVVSDVVVTGDDRHLILSTNNSLVGADVNGINDIYLIDRNDAPTVNSNGVASLNAIIQNSTTSPGTPVGDIVNALFSDVDNFELSEPGMAITGVDNSNGTWQYSTDFGNTWQTFTGLSDSSATLLSGGRILTSEQVGTTNIAASELFINGTATTAITLATSLNNGINMKGAWNLAAAINAISDTTHIWADLTTLYSSNVAATIGGSTTVDFFLNGVNVNFTTSGASVSQVITDTIAAINALSDQTHVLAFAGDGTNGGVSDAIVLQNTEFGTMHPIDIKDLTETGGASTGLTNMHQEANATSNTGQISFFSKEKFEISTSAGDDSILSLIGLAGGSNTTKQPDDTAADGRILVNSGPSRIRFVPNTDYVGTASITFRTWDFTDGQEGDTGFDVSNNGGSTAFSATSASADITVVPLAVDHIAPDGAEFQVNTYTPNNQAGAFITELAGGNFVITWSSTSQDGSSDGVYGQLYNTTGTAIGSEFLINTTTTDSQVTPPVAALNNGGFVVTWTSNTQDGALGGIYGQLFNASGTKVGTEFLINSTTTDNQHSSSVAALANGGFVVSWVSDNQDGGGTGVYGRQYDSSGTAVGSEFQINTTATADQHSPVITGLKNGGFVVAWASNLQDGSAYGVYGQQYGENGNPVGTEFQINSYTANDQKTPVIGALRDGGFIVAWESDGQDGDLNGIYAQRYSANGSRVGSEFMVNSQTAGEQTLLRSANAIAALADGGYVITWSSNNQDGSSYGVYGQRYDADNNAVDPEFLINTYTTSDQKAPTVTGRSDGGFIVTWESQAQDGDSLGIFAQRYQVNASPTISAGATTNYTEGDPPALIDAGITLTDPDDTTLESATINIAPGYIDGEDVLSFSAIGAITGVWNPATATLTLTGTDSLTNYQTALRSVTYKNISDTPNTSPRTINFTVSDGASDSSVANSVITVSSVTPATPTPVSPPPATPPPPAQTAPPPTSPLPPQQPPTEPLPEPSNFFETVLNSSELSALTPMPEPLPEPSADALATLEPQPEPPPPEPEQGPEPTSDQIPEEGTAPQPEPTTEASIETLDESEGEVEEVVPEEEQGKEALEEEGEDESDEEESEEEIVVDELPADGAPAPAPQNATSVPEQATPPGTGMTAQLAAEAEKLSVEHKKILKVLDEAFQLLQCK